MSFIELFVFPHAGGHKHNYSLFAPLFPANISLNILEYPGRGERVQEPLLEDREELVDYLCEQIISRSHTPYAFWGHSMGATLGYAVARRLKLLGYSLPLHLFASGRQAPSVEPAETIHNLPSKDFWAKLIAMDGISEAFLEHEELRNYFEPILRADCKIADASSYQPGAPLPLPISVLLGQADLFVDAIKVAPWQKETTHQLRVQEFAGDHFFVFQRPEEVAQLIQRTLQQSLTTVKQVDA
ncbi:thioesterase [Hymenobacter sp. BT664]|uniref:Thioesterase n=1 Tax=Hymenobacter montanus TaxID=2771359 RepID=A0A927BB38_9BACT|nr:alpha/beta fold hydrolase [Hymenobacter montanus]MBD2767191.1 thioesterase [Hymenobacter montanus]